jgi:hypothetical protein
MVPTLVRTLFHRDGWVYEEKIDGWRIVAYKDRDRVRLLSRHGVDHTRRFADVARAITKLSARTLVLDGEIAVYDQQLRSRFPSGCASQTGDSDGPRSVPGPGPYAAAPGCAVADCGHRRAPSSGASPRAGVHLRVTASVIGHESLTLHHLTCHIVPGHPASLAAAGGNRERWAGGGRRLARLDLPPGA